MQSRQNTKRQLKSGAKKTVIIVGIELFIALIFVVGADWAGGNARRFFHNYFADIAVPFGYYFPLILVENRQKVLRPWYGKALAVFLLTATSEILQYFGVYALARVFDPLDFAMYAVGVLLAALVDTQVISRFYREMHASESFGQTWGRRLTF
jgi:hypothetical protein